MIARRLAACGRFLLLPLTLAVAGPAQADPSCDAPAAKMARVELYFGTGGVTEHAFAHFLAYEVTPRFPDGLSLFRAYGQWRDGKGRISRESSRLLVIYYRPDGGANERIEAIRAIYKKRFHQQSVLRADGEACVSF